MSLSVRRLRPEEVRAALDALAELRIAVFRDWPYLYDGTPEYERRYLSVYASNPQAVLIGAYDGDRLVGAATGTPMEDHAGDFAAAFAGSGMDLATIFYCAESVLLPDYRGRGIGHRFFDAREAAARQMGRAFSAFCAVQRSDDHPMRPADVRSLEPFWRKRGYAPLPGVVAKFTWKDLDAAGETAKPLQFWGRRLPQAAPGADESDPKAYAALKTL